MKYQGSIDSVEIETDIIGVRVYGEDVELLFTNGDKLMIWKQSYAALGMPSVCDRVKIIVKPLSPEQKEPDQH
jgi:hypothetical protein